MPVAGARTAPTAGGFRHARLCARILNLAADHYMQGDEDPPTFVMHAIVKALDQVEESAALQPADRLKGAEWIRRMVEDTMAFWEMRTPIRRYARGEQSPIWNHETYPCLSIGHAAQFLKARYPIPAADYWEAVVDDHLAGQMACDQPPEDSANYQRSVPKHMMSYSG